MRAHEFLSQLIRQAQQSQGSVTVNIGSINIDTKPEPADVENAMDRDDIMIPPLQQKIEMMKKMSGVEPKNQEFAISEDDEPLDQ